MKTQREEQIERAPSSVPVMGHPETAFELINKYGTYNIQPTADTDNAFPTIAQGYSKYLKKPSLAPPQKTKKNRH